MAIEKNPYEVLDISPFASQEQLRTKYRSLVQKYHPDLHPNDAAAAIKMEQVNAAYDLVGNPEARREYDAAQQERIVEEKGPQTTGKPTAEATKGAWQAAYEKNVADVAAAEAEWAARKTEETEDRDFVSSVWAAGSNPQMQTYANGWALARHIIWLIIRVIFAILFLLLRFLNKDIEEGDDFFNF